MKDLLSREEVKLYSYLKTFMIPTGIYLIIAIFLNSFTAWFSLYWLIFGFFIVFPISTANGFALYVLMPIDNSPEGKKRASIIAVESIFQWLCYDFCYLSIFNNWIISTYILGVISVVLMFIETINTFLFNTKKLSFLFIIELLVGIGLTVYLIYIIPENLSNLQTIITTIVAALFGGLFTLLGVAWTIREHYEKHKKENNKNEIFKYMLNETINKCQVEEFYFQNEFFYKYIYPKIDGNKPPKDDFVTSKISKSPFVFDKEIIDLSLSGSIEDKYFVVYAKLKSTYEEYVETKIIFYDKPECYMEPEKAYRNSLADAKKLVEKKTNE